jgi:hypothetical protein
MRAPPHTHTHTHTHTQHMINIEHVPISCACRTIHAPRLPIAHRALLNSVCITVHRYYSMSQAARQLDQLQTITNHQPSIIAHVYLCLCHVPGVETGQCTNGFCQVYSWGPMEPKSAPPAIMNEVQNMTLFIRATSFFPSYRKVRNNIGSQLTPGCNFFSVSDILQAANIDFAGIAQNV